MRPVLVITKKRAMPSQLLPLEPLTYSAATGVFGVTSSCACATWPIDNFLGRFLVVGMLACEITKNL